MKKLEHCVYVLRSRADGNRCVGYTVDLHRRLTEHMQGRSAVTAPRLPFELVFCEFYKAKSDALRRESYLKTTQGKRALALMLRDSLSPD